MIKVEVGNRLRASLGLVPKTGDVLSFFGKKLGCGAIGTDKSLALNWSMGARTSGANCDTLSPELRILSDEDSCLEKGHLYIFLMTDAKVLGVWTIMDCYVLVVVSG